MGALLETLDNGFLLQVFYIEGCPIGSEVSCRLYNYNTNSFFHYQFNGNGTGNHFAIESARSWARDVVKYGGPPKEPHPQSNDITCFACEVKLEKIQCSLPVYEDLILSSNYKGEMSGFRQHSCLSCYAFQGTITEVLSIEEFIRQKRSKVGRKAAVAAVKERS